jgi:hypothetical protein
MRDKALSHGRLHVPQLDQLAGLVALFAGFDRWNHSVGIVL